MRIKVLGDNPTAKGLRGTLQAHDFQLVTLFPSFTLHIEENSALSIPLIDSVDSEIERKLVKHLGEQFGGVEIQVEGGVRSESAARIVVPTGDEPSFKLQRAVFRALIEHQQKR